MTVFEIKPGIGFDEQRLKDLLPDTESLLFLAKLYELDKAQLAELMYFRFRNHDVVHALVSEGDQHSNELQDYLVEVGYGELVERGMAAQSPTKPKAEILPEVWKSLEIIIADSIKEVGEALVGSVSRMTGKKGRLVMQQLMQLNARRPTIGDYKAQIKHQHQGSNLIILDVSGSMSEETVRTIIGDVVGLAWEADAYLAIVSNTCTWWKPGEYDVDVVLARSEFGGTHYEELAELFRMQSWDVVVTIADYDSSYGAKAAIEATKGHVHKVLDISLVNQPTFLSEVVGTIADEVKPILIGRNYYVY